MPYTKAICTISFRFQGVNLANIIKDLTLNEETGEPILIESIEKLKGHADGSASLNDDEFERVIADITQECDKVRRINKAKDKKGNLHKQISQISLCRIGLWLLRMDATS